MDKQLKELLIRADAALSALYHRGEHSIPWVQIGGDDFRSEVDAIITALRKQAE